MPIPSQARERVRPASLRRARVGVGFAFLACGLASAHEPGADSLPDRPGWQLGAAAAVVAPAADARWPTAGWPGVLVLGSAPRDQRRGLRLEHATIELASRIDARRGARLAVGWHDRDRAHLEAAVLQGDYVWRGQALRLQVGRDTVRLGGVIDGAGHFDVFSQPPLAKRGVLNEQWIDDGIRAQWQAAGADGLRALELGLWRGRSFPGGPAGPAVPSVHVHGGLGHLDAHLSVARLQPRSRGAAAQLAGATGHVHGNLDCRASLQQRVCFDGAVDLLAGSVRWEPDDSAWSFSAAGLLRHERGALYAAAADADFRATVSGLWADARWRLRPDWQLAARAERLSADNRLQGVGTAALAGASGLATAGGPVERLTLAVQHEIGPSLALSFEAGQERHAAGRVSHVALRAVWRNPGLLGGRW